jgi:secreted Zn-dependent insulinase-like peptidase
MPSLLLYLFTGDAIVSRDSSMHLYELKTFSFCHQEAMTKEYENFKFRQPYQQVLYYCSLILEDQTWPWDEEFSALSHLEASDLGIFLPHLLSKTFIECYFAGLSI